MAPKKKRTAIKSCKVHTADTTVLKQIVWQHKLVYDPSGKPAAYDELPLPIFIQGYLAISAPMIFCGIGYSLAKKVTTNFRY